MLSDYDLVDGLLKNFQDVVIVLVVLKGLSVLLMLALRPGGGVNFRRMTISEIQRANHNQLIIA